MVWWSRATSNYAIQDWTNNRKTQWRGSLKRNRNLVMVGEVRQSADNSTFQYMEWIYDRSKNGALVMQMTAQCTMALPTPTTQPYVARQPYNVTPRRRVTASRRSPAGFVDHGSVEHRRIFGHNLRC